jgi:hypothetical protein
LLVGGSEPEVLSNVADLQANNTNAACRDLGAFINEVNAQSGKKRTLAEAQQLLSSASQIETAIGCR